MLEKEKKILLSIKNIVKSSYKSYELMDTFFFFFTKYTGTTLIDNSAPTLLKTKDTKRLHQLSEVASMFVSDEKTSWNIAQKYEVDYVMIVFGGRTGYVSDDMNR